MRIKCFAREHNESAPAGQASKSQLTGLKFDDLKQSANYELKIYNGWDILVTARVIFISPFSSVRTMLCL